MYIVASERIAKLVAIEDDVTDFPGSITRIDADFTKNDESRYNINDETLIKLLKNASKKVRDVCVENINELSPERAEILTLMISTAGSLHIKNWLCTVPYSCLASCLPQSDGLKELYLSSTTPVSIDQARLLFEGIASSSSLKRLDLHDLRFDNGEGSGRAFVNALERNRSLNKLNFSLSSFGSAAVEVGPIIFYAAILDTQVRSLTMHAGFGSSYQFPSNGFRDVLGQERCLLEEFFLEDIVIVPTEMDSVPPSDTEQSAILFNTSVKKLSPSMEVGTMLHLSQISEVFKSLVSLDLPCCDISDLSLLDPLLIGDQGSLTLLNLQLFGNPISEQNAIDFFRKLPQMTRIRDVCLGQASFLFGNAWMEVLLDAIKLNKSLECLQLCSLREAQEPLPSEELTEFCSKLDDSLRTNRERRLRMDFLASVGSKVLPERLWPLILERAKRISRNYFNTYTDSWEKRPLESLKADLVNRVLKEKMARDHLY